MTPDEYRVLTSALNSLSSVQVDTHVYAHQKQYNESAYDYDVLGRQVMSMRMLAEFVGVPNEFMLPGEFYEDDSDLEGLFVYTPNKRSKPDDPLTVDEKKWLRQRLLPVLYQVSGTYDADDAVLRCVRRMIAEVSGCPELSHYRLLYEKEVGPLYLKAYQPLED